MGMEMRVLTVLMALCILQLDASRSVPKLAEIVKLLNYTGTTPATKQFYLDKTKVTWEEAFQQCHQRNMSLAKITSQSDQNVIEAYLKSDPPQISVWTAGVVKENVMKIHDPLKDVVWKISMSKNPSTQDMTYLNWDRDEPLIGDQPPQRCVALLNINYNWWLAGCQSKKPFVCEK